MPSGKIHTTASVTIALGLAISDVGNTMVAGCVAGILLSPDLDVNSGYIGYRYLPQPIRFLWWAYWTPYRKLVKHRSWVSHFPVVSTAIRILYIAAPFMVYLWYTQTVPVVEDWMLPAFIGLMLSDTAHYMMDMFWRTNESNR